LRIRITTSGKHGKLTVPLDTSWAKLPRNARAEARSSVLVAAEVDSTAGVGTGGCGTTGFGAIGFDTAGVAGAAALIGATVLPADGGRDAASAAACAGLVWVTGFADAALA
jgi:hypothetical protein